MKENFLLLMYEITVTFLPMLLTVSVYCRKLKRENFPISAAHYWFLIFYGIYLIGVFYITGAGTLWTFFREGLDLHHINLTLFTRDYFETMDILNVIMLVPFGFFVPLLYKNWNHLGKITLLGGSLSLLIEFSQLLTTRFPDVDDLFYNALGAVVGYGCWRLLACLSKKEKNFSKFPSSGLLLMPMVIFLSRFFLFDKAGFLSLISEYI